MTINTRKQPATSRSSRVSHARYTSPIPPAPRRRCEHATNNERATAATRRKRGEASERAIKERRQQSEAVGSLNQLVLFAAG
jgi:hypothetical protein